MIGSREASPVVFAFACRIAGRPEWGETIYNARSAGEAKARYWDEVSDVWEGILFTQVRVRKLGAAHTSPAFERTAQRRGLPHARCGQEVRVGEHGNGVIVGHNASANFDVLFVSGPWNGQRLNCHPATLEFLS